MPYTPSHVIHVEFGPQWLPFDGRHVFAKLNQARAVGLTLPKAQLKHLGELSLYIATRTSILRICVDDLSIVQQRIIETILASPQDTALLNLSDRDLYSLLLYLDSFLFELHALDANLCKFFCATLTLLGKPEPAAKYSALAHQCGYVGNERAKQFLTIVRNKLSHHVAPWVAIAGSRRDIGVIDFILMFKNITDFETASPRDYFFVNRDLNHLWTAFQTLLETVEEYLVQQIPTR